MATDDSGHMPTRKASEIRRAVPAEATCLSELALRSKAVWGYSSEFMAACRDELTLSQDYIETSPTFVVELEAEPVGFYSLERLSPKEVELGLLFVEPEAIGRGHGRQLIEHAKAEARTAGYVTMVIQGDPNAERFYSAAGGRLVGTRESLSIPGRVLPLFHIDLFGAQKVSAP